MDGTDGNHVPSRLDCRPLEPGGRDENGAENNRSFVYALVEYAWLFEDALDVDDTFDDGRFSWTIGVGFNF